MQIITPILDGEIQKNQEERAGREKTSFWASEAETMAFEIYHRWIGTPPTNPIDEEKIMMLNMRKLTEEAVVEMVRRSGKLIDRYTNGERCYFEYGEHKVPISGYPDLGIMVNGQEVMVEVKTFYGEFQNKLIANGDVKTNYLKQLIIYMFHFNVPNGILFLINQGTGERFEYGITRCSQTNPHLFSCIGLNIEIDIEDTFKRWEQIYIANILAKKEPEPEFKYKYPLKEIVWEEISNSRISKARTNKAVIGDWQALYSDYKDLIIQKEGTHLGYNDEEIEFIKEATKGYSSKKK